MRELEVNNNPQNFLERVVRTFPLEPRFFRMKMYSGADGSNYDRLSTDIPTLSIWINYNSEKSEFYCEDVNISHDLCKLLKGRMNYEIGINPDVELCDKDSFDNFKEGLFNDLLEKNYSILDGDIWVNTLEDMGSFRGPGINFRRMGEENGILQLDTEFRSDIPPLLKEEDKEKMISWFNELEKNYS